MEEGPVICYTQSYTSVWLRLPPIRLQLLHITSCIVWVYPVRDQMCAKECYVYVMFCC